EDFSKHKMVWKRVGSILRFSYDDSGALALDSTCFATGDNIKFLVAFLNSKLGKYLLKDAPQTGTGDLLISVQAIQPLSIPIPSIEINEKFEVIIDQILSDNSFAYEIESILDLEIYNLLNLTSEEISFIESYYI
ncbi:hypothetical protein, partial [Chryseobacterium sp. 'Rf worker isolate 10']|uniref:hypothetical protein n=1 Tax=Chryseobacterium sp. 'Rf worker isolate 10' TaxID=2887348 RepID=UPI003D6E5B22